MITHKHTCDQIHCEQSLLCDTVGTYQIILCKWQKEGSLRIKPILLVHGHSPPTTRTTHSKKKKNVRWHPTIRTTHKNKITRATTHKDTCDQIHCGQSLICNIVGTYQNILRKWKKEGRLPIQQILFVDGHSPPATKKKALEKKKSGFKKNTHVIKFTVASRFVAT